MNFSEKNMRICIITPEFVTEHYFSGGIAQQFYKIAKWEVNNGHEVHVITLSHKNEKIRKDGIIVHRIKNKRSFLIKIINKITFNKFYNSLNAICFSFYAYRKVKILHRQLSFDIVHDVVSKDCGLFTSLFTKIPRVTFVACYRPAWNFYSNVSLTFDTKVCEFLEKIVLRTSKNLFTPSFILKEMIETNEHIKISKVIPTPFYIEISELDDSIYRQYLSGKIYSLFIGRLQLHKGVHVLGQALPKVFLKYPELYAVFVGLDSSTKLVVSMKEYIKKLCKNNKDRLIFIDQIPHSQLYPIIQKAKLVVLPSLIDNLPNVLLESMGMSKPVIGTYGCSFDEVIEDGISGFLVPPGNFEALADKIIEVWQRKDLDRIGKTAKEKIKELSPEHTVKQLLEYYEYIIRNLGSTKKKSVFYK